MRASMDFKMRLFRIDQMIKEQGPVTFEDLQSALKCSAPTVKRDLNYLRKNLHAPIVYSHALKGYVYEGAKVTEGADEDKQGCDLPAQWYSPTEMFVLMTALDMFDTIEEVRDGLLFGEMRALKSRLMSLIQEDKTQVKELQKRIKVVHPPMRVYRNSFFEVIGKAVAMRKRLRIMYFTRKDQIEKDREISPLRLVCYRNNWYLDAYCHRTQALKTFNLDYIRHVVVLTKLCASVPMRDIEAQLDSSYGIFSGSDLKTAEIVVDRHAGAFVRNEIWHKDQVLTRQADGGFLLKVPYANPTELIGQILRLGEHARVVAPACLRDDVRQVLERTQALYHDTVR